MPGPGLTGVVRAQGRAGRLAEVPPVRQPGRLPGRVGIADPRDDDRALRPWRPAVCGLVLPPPRARWLGVRGPGSGSPDGGDS
jgi:hypothetical protein